MKVCVVPLSKGYYLSGRTDKAVTVTGALEDLIRVLLGEEEDSSLDNPPARSSKRLAAKAAEIGSKILKSGDPLIVLALDEAHSLTLRGLDPSQPYSAFSELR